MAVYATNHKVEDFDAWKKAYDSFESKRKHFDIRDHYVLRSTQDGNHVMVLGEGTLEAVQGLLQSDELREAMGKAGVIGPVEIFVGENVK